MDIAALIDEVIAREGGYGHHPADRGGATNFGITEAVARANGYAGDMRRLPRAFAETIYRRLYWEYLNDSATNTEQTMSPAEFVAFRKTLERDSNIDSI